jgi:uncharacterized protein YyaL (SSP411 family)
VNRLAGSTSPYLEQHAGNPVDWWPWCPEAFEEAKRREVPVVLSVGYAACHWCHVMAHESFEDGATARQMNEGFVSIKVDREERPDVDAVYMSATQALTGQGGWPMTVFLTPDGRPFYAGTYFPPRPAPGMPSFGQVLTAIGDAWRDRRAELEAAGGRIATALAARGLPVAGGPVADGELAEVVTSAVQVLAGDEDAEYGGFGGAPKFPSTMDLEFLLRHAAAGDGASTPASRGTAREVAARTLRAMAHSGMYDQLGGGFARYAVDRAWIVPHFEKMLYDNALLARVYLHWWRLTGEPAGARIALETCDWIVSGLGTAEGGFASSLDADTPLRAADGPVRGVEGFTYVWTPGQLAEVLGPEDGAWAASLLQVSAGGSFEHGASTLRLAHDVWASPEAERWRQARRALLDARARRPQPGRDDKVVAAWNGLAIAALAETGALLDRPDLVGAATRCAALLMSVHVSGTASGGGLRLHRVSRGGVAGDPQGVLEDYGDVAEGLLALHAVTGDPGWLDRAGALLDTVLAHFRDPDGAWYDTAGDATDGPLLAVRRPQDPTDNAYPSGATAVAGALLGYGALTGSGPHREAAAGALGAVRAQGGTAPRAFGWGLAVLQALLDGPREVAVAGPDGDPLRAQLHQVALAGTAPGLVVTVGAPGSAGAPLLAGRTLPGGRSAAYVCRDFTCRVPTSVPGELAAQVGARFPAGPSSALSPGQSPAQSSPESPASVPAES